MTVAGHATLEGVTSTGATGTGNLVFDSSPTLITPTLGVATGTRLGLGVAADGTAALNVAGLVQPSTDNARDLGTSSLRWRTAYFGTSLFIGVPGSYPLDIALSSTSGTSGIYPSLRVSNASTATLSIADVTVSGNNSAVVGRFLNDGLGGTGYFSGAAVAIGTVTNHQFGFITNNTSRARFDTSGNFELFSKLTKYNNVATVSQGVPSIYGSGRSTAQTAAVASVATYTNAASDGSFIVSANANVTTSTTHNFTVTVAYTDETNTSRTLTLSFFALSGGAPISSITNVTGAGPYEGCSAHIRVKASTAITIATTGTFTSVTYNVEGYITQIG